MKAVMISDTHTHHESLLMPAADILLCAGDITNVGDLTDLVNFARWLEGLPYKHKVIIAGNHDFCFEHDGELCRKVLEHGGATYLQDEEVVIDGKKIYGSPWQPRFFDWAFNLDKGESLRKVWAKIPDDTDVLITHGPPQGILDECRSGKVGCAELLKRIIEVKPDWHIFGHIHPTYGYECAHGTTFVNASSCNERYRPVNTPIVMEL